MAQSVRSFTNFAGLVALGACLLLTASLAVCEQALISADEPHEESEAPQVLGLIDTSTFAPESVPPELRFMYKKLRGMELAKKVNLNLCKRWAKLNRRYIGYLGPQRRQRPSELAMNERCKQIRLMIGHAQTKLASFRNLFTNGNPHLEYVSNLVSEYIDIEQSIDKDEFLQSEYEKVLENPQVQVGVENLKSFVGFFLERLIENTHFRDKVVHAAKSVAHSEMNNAPENVENGLDDIGQLDQAIKKLIDREGELADDDLRYLIDLAHILERVLADREAVDVTSGRYRYLSGTLDGARAVILHRISERDLLDSQPQEYGPEVAPSESQEYVNEMAPMQQPVTNEMLTPQGFDGSDGPLVAQQPAPQQQGESQDQQQAHIAESKMNSINEFNDKEALKAALIEYTENQKRQQAAMIEYNENQKRQQEAQKQQQQQQQQESQPTLPPQKPQKVQQKQQQAQPPAQQQQQQQQQQQPQRTSQKQSSGEQQGKREPQPPAANMPVSPLWQMVAMHQ